MAFTSKRSVHRAPPEPTSRPQIHGPVRYFYNDDAEGGIRSVQVHLEARQGNSYDTLIYALGLLEQARSEILWKSRHHLPWKSPSALPRRNMEFRSARPRDDESLVDEFDGLPEDP